MVSNANDAALCVQPWAAIIIGFTGGGVYCFASWLIANVLRIDDPLDAGAVHAFCGAWGLLMAAAFAHAPNVERVYGSGVADAGHGAQRYISHLLPFRLPDVEPAAFALAPNVARISGAIVADAGHCVL